MSIPALTHTCDCCFSTTALDAFDPMKQLSAESNYRNTHAPNIYNTMVHAKSTEINTDLPAGERKHLQELQNIVSKTCDPSTLSKEECDNLCGRLLNHCETNSLGSRANNLAAARDVLVTANRIGKELDNLAARTAITQWTSGRILSGETRTNLLCYLNNGLVHEIRPSMNKKNLLTAANSASGFVGAACDMPFVNPSTIGTVLEICKLHDAWKTGSCHWVKLT
ncbi:hypothetical protein SERLADRAFT_404549 [Serpula lacrymans var. lacrymans S7.9]|uniref:Uncharacterized protein n=1 Tax=Serpula lacrymans var. lacrymans (strain S7.9) TaxID=578457 RepID=F8NDP1_SERL9|nr:uncharacterized protein SERLADRAFT_404549 [Serpula lacrymans var. lacrymans S7.9]EGO30325.1 hypothetical protein SERLADRAFT_404549 [Serpula lacrymans var. lacrymans S7.9]